MMGTAALLMAISLLAIDMRGAHGHGYLASPLSRNMHSNIYDSWDTKEYTPNQLFAGGVGVVSGGFSRLWPRGLYGVCGDRHDDPAPRWMVPRPVSAVWVEGQEVELLVGITADHKGRFAFRICPSTNATEACFEQNWLTRADPVRPGAHYWYLTSKGDGSAREFPSSLGAYANTPSYALRYRLPPGLTCTACVLQWWYATANSCTLPCTAEDPDWNPAAGPTSCDRQGMGICGSSTSRYPEEFWNCADVTILPRSGSGGATQSPPPPSAVSPTVQPSPSPRPPPPASSGGSTTGPCSTANWCVGKATGLYGNPCDATCGTYINCANGVTYVQSCQAGLVFNPALKVCDWPANVQCNTGGSGSSSSPPPPPPSATRSPPPPSVVASPSPPPPAASSSPPPPSGSCSTTNWCTGKATGLYTNPCDATCKTFLSCNNGATYTQSCQPGLMFNPSLKVCDWPANVKCSPSTTTNPSSSPPPPAATTSPPPPSAASPSPPPPSSNSSPSPSSSSPSPSSLPSPSPYRVVGYLENWRWYQNGGVPPALTAYLPRLTHINYAFATVSYSPEHDSYYMDMTDTWADVGACLTGSCPQTCIKLNATCPGDRVGMAPTTKTTSTSCPASCFNGGGAPGYPRQCNTVVKDLSTPLRACGHYAYVQKFIREAAPHVRVLISVGGWYDSNYFTMASRRKYRSQFIDSIIDFLDTFGFDGVDFDWEYPGFEHGGQPPYGGPADYGSPDDVRDCSTATCTFAERTRDGGNFANTVAELRQRLSSRLSRRGEPYLITMAGPAGVDKLSKMDMVSLCSSMDWVNIMTYDMHGPWDGTTGHQSALDDPQTGDPLTVAAAVREYVARGCQPSKLVVGVPFYGRTFKGVDPGPDPKLPGYKQLFSSSLTTQLGSATAMPNQKTIAASGMRIVYDTARNASYAYDAASRTFITFDDERAVAAKAWYVRKAGLGGAMVWALGMETPQLWQALVENL